jgi:hypothetical protein
MRVLFFIILLISIFDCENNSFQDLEKDNFKERGVECCAQVEKKITDEDISINNIENYNTQDDLVLLDGYHGLIIVDLYSETSFDLLNSDTSVFKKFKIVLDDSKASIDSLDYYYNSFNMFAYSYDYALFIFYAKIKGDYCELHTKNGNIILLPKHSECYKFMTWNEFLKEGEYISVEGFSYLCEEIDSKEKKDIESSYLFKVVNIKENWAFIKGEPLYNDYDPIDGWVKWHDNNHLLIDFSFIM